MKYGDTTARVSSCGSYREAAIQLSTPRKPNTSHCQSRQNFHKQRQWDSRANMSNKKGAEQGKMMRGADMQKALPAEQVFEEKGQRWRQRQRQREG